MLENVLGDYLDHLTNERAMDAPFLALLSAMGFQDVHLTHGPIEKGRDFIAKSPDRGVQWAFQTKQGDLGVPDLNRGVFGQIQAAALTGIGHAAFDTQLPRQVVLVTTGTVTQQAHDQLDRFSDDALAKLGHPRLKVWGREHLVHDFMQFGLEAVKKTQLTATDLEAQGRFFLLYGGAVGGALNLEEADDHSVGWLREGMNERQMTLLGAVEAALLTDACTRSGLLYEAIYVQLAALRMAMARLHTTTDDKRREELTNLCKAQFETCLTFSANYSDTALMAWEANDRDMVAATSSPAAFVTYPVHCLRLCEVLGLLALSEHGEMSVLAARKLVEFTSREPGCFHPVSDRYAISTVVATLALLRHGYLDQAKAMIRKTAVWLFDRVEKGMGIAHVDATVQEEVDQLLGYAFRGLGLDKQTSSLLATFLIDLAAFARDDRLYGDLVNDMLAVEIHPENFQAPDSPAQFLVDHPEVVHTTGIELAEELPSTPWPSHTPCGKDEQQTYSIADDLGPATHVGLSLLLRDRAFLGLWPLLVPDFSL